MSCGLLCHDANHNGDFGPGCGNPLCWKFDPETSPPARPIRPDQRCQCPWGTFEGEDKRLTQDKPDSGQGHPTSPTRRVIPESGS